MVLLQGLFILSLILRTTVTPFPLSLFPPDADAHASLSSQARAVAVAGPHVVNLWQCRGNCQLSLNDADGYYCPWPEQFLPSPLLSSVEKMEHGDNDQRGKGR